MIKELNLVNSDLILNSSRILVLISKFESKKSFKMNLNKIMLYDFYMKFPRTMIKEEITGNTQQDFNEFYSFFHWQPDRDEYNLYLRYLLSKKLIDRVIIDKDFCFQISERGEEALSKLESLYSSELNIIAEYVKKEVSRKSDSFVEKTIINNIGMVNHE